MSEKEVRKKHIRFSRLEDTVMRIYWELDDEEARKVVLKVLQEERERMAGSTATA